MKIRLVLSISLPILVLLLTGCGPPVQAIADPSTEIEIEPVSTTVFGEGVLLFMEYPRLVRGESARFLAHLTVLDTGEPVRSGRVMLEVGSLVLAVDGPKRDGLFTPEGSFSESGGMPARLVVTSEQVAETLDLGEFTVHATLDEARVAAAAETGEDPSNSAPFLMEQQWKLKLLLAGAEPQRLTRRLVVPARVVSAEGASAVVAAPLAGRLLPPAGGALARSGETVESGQELALVEPPLTAQLRSLALEWDLRSLEVEHALAGATARLRFAESEHERIVQLRPAGLASQAQLDQAERDLALAQGAMHEAQAARAALDELRSRRAGSEAVSSDGAPRFSVRAPISGVLVGSGRVLGESLEAGDTLFRIVDPSRLWIEGRVSEFDLAHVGRAPQAAVTLPALPGRRIDVGGTGQGRMLMVGPEVDVDSRTVVIRYELPDPDGGIRPGMLAELEIAVETVDAHVAIPFDAVVMDQGLPTAYVMLGGESFQRRDLELGLRDGELVEVRSGVNAGEHVATRGAATIRLAALSPASFGAGHAH